MRVITSPASAPADGAGRDATDAAISTAFGNAELKRFEVITRQIPA
jgi:hypothetical protein